MSPIPKNMFGEPIVEFQVFGKNVDVNFPDGPTNWPQPMQVRLSNGKGFVATDNGRTNLIDMPTQLKGGGQLEYNPGTTTLTNEHGSFIKFLGKTGNAADAPVRADLDANRFIFTGEGDSYTIKQMYSRRGGTTFHPDGHISMQDGEWVPRADGMLRGRQWEFSPDGAITMRSLPAGRHQLRIEPNAAEAEYTHSLGSNEAIAARATSGNHLPEDQTITSLPVDWAEGKVGTFQIPDIIAPANPSRVDELFNARNILNGIYRS